MFQRTIVRATPVARNARLLHATPAARKTVTEKVSEVAGTVNKKLGKGLASAMEKGEEMTKKTQETAGTAKGETEKKANQATAAAKDKMNQASQGARKASEDMQKEMKP